MKRLSALLFWQFGVLAAAQDPMVGGQLRTSVDPLCKSASETTAAASSDGSEIVAGFVDFRADGTIKNSFGVSSDSGQTWSHVIVRPPAQYQDNLEADPMTAYDQRTNTLFAGGISRAKCIYVAKKLPGQNSFGPSVVCRLSSWPDKAWMAAGPRPGLPNTTRLYIAYNEGIIWSDDLGATWTPPQSLGTNFGFLPRVGPAGELYLTYWDGYWGIKFRRSLDGGQSWEAEQQPGTRMTSWGVENYGIPGLFRNFTNNAMAVNPRTGEIVILWVDQTNIINGQKNLDLYMVRSGDRGVTWTAAERLPFRPLGQISDMIFPWIEFTKDGRLHLMAMDTSFNPGQTDGADHGLWNQVYVYSDDSGRSWSNLLRLTPTSWDSYFDGTGGYRFLGDYQGMAMSDKSVFPLYPDTRTGEAEAITHRIYDPIERPASFNWFRGFGLSGELESLWRHDGDVARAKPGFVLSMAEAPLQIETVTSVPTSAPASMKVCLWSSVDRLNIGQSIQLLNRVTGRWDTIDSRVASTSLANTSVTVVNPASYIADRAVRVRVAFKPFTPVLPWNGQVDQMVLLVVP